MSWAAPAVGLDCLFRGERCLYEWSSTSKHEEDCPSAEDGLEVKCSVTENTKVSRGESGNIYSDLLRN